jgi:hypothetical protein
MGLPWAFDSHTWLGLIAFWRGDWPSAEEHYERGLKTEAHGTVAGAPAAFLLLLSAYLGDERRCRKMLDRAGNGLPGPGRAASLGAWTTLTNVVEALWLLKDFSAAGRLYPHP